MPTVQFNTREVVGMLGKETSIDLLRERIPMLGVDLIKLDDDVLEMEVFPNRPDMLCVEGFARALKGFLGFEKGPIGYKVSDSRLSLTVEPSVTGVRPFITAAVVYGLSITDDFLVSIMNVQEKLHLTHGRNRVKLAIGIHDLDKIKNPFTYKAVRPDSISFVPLDMNRKMNMAEVLKEHPKGREYAFAVVDCELYPVILDRDNKVLSFPPIINGELTRVTRQTKNLFIEVTGKSELAVDQALNIITTAFADRGGKITSVEIKNKK